MSIYENLDVLLLLLLLVIIEYRSMREYYILFSPIALFCVSLLYVYVLPLMLYSTNVENYIHRLSIDEYSKLAIYVRVFVYLFFLFTLVNISKQKKRIRSGVYFQTDTFLEKYQSVISKITRGNNILLFNLIVITTFILAQLIMCGFNVALTIQKIINPRDYTYFRSSFGVFNVLIGFCQTAVLFFNTAYFMRRKTLKGFFFIALAIGLNLLGGSKASLIRAMIFAGLLAFQSRRKAKRVKMMTLLIISICGLVVMLLSFSIMQVSEKKGTSETVNQIIGRIINYSQEAYYSGKVLNDFEPKFEYIADVTKSIVLSPIPRQIWHGKGYYGLYNNYWRPIYQPNTVIYHTSTYGFLAEGQMLCGFLSPLIYAILFSIFLDKLNSAIYKRDGLVKTYVTISLASNIYFFVRTGLFQSSVIWTYIVSAVFFFILVSLLQKGNVRKQKIDINEISKISTTQQQIHTKENI